MQSVTTTIFALTGDRVLYRDLQPYAAELPGLVELRASLGLPPDQLPRKRDRDYARVIMRIAEVAQAQRGGPPLQHCLVIGDTENDRLLARYLAEPGDLQVAAFIGIDRPDETAQLAWQGIIAEANRWALLAAWGEQVAARGLDWQATVLLIDIDKTLLGPRGRSDAAIDDSRAAGALRVACEISGAGLDEMRFRSIYRRLCGKEYHSFTLDNQDYVVYSALLVARGVLSLEELDAGRAGGRIGSFAGLLELVGERLPPELSTLHGEIAGRVRQGDPTPFKRFRYAELEETLARMADGRLTLCRELFELVEFWIARGALCLAASDKPAEASLPSPAQQAAGLLPLHRMPARLG